MQIGISIVKSVSFRLIQQEFSNVYHYNLAGASTAPYQSLIDEVVAIERDFHSTDVTFKRAAVWSSGGTKEQNQMLYQTTLTGVGNKATAASQDRERALLLRWPAGVDSRGKPVYLRKWFHSCGAAASWIATTPQLQNTAAIDDTSRAAIASLASGFNEIGVAEAWSLVSESGRGWEANPECHKFLEHHQLGDAWR